MSHAPQPDPKEISGMLKLVHQLGTTTESFFNRLYGGLYQRSLEADKRELEEQQQLLSLTVEQIREENAKLQQLIHLRNREIRRFQSVLANIQEGIVMQDLDGRILMMNEAAQRLLGNQKKFWESELGILFNEFRDIETLNTEIMPLGETRQIQLDERVLAVQLAAVAEEDGQRIGTVVILRDITHEEFSERLKSGIITHISHELKTPMAVLRLASEVLLGQPKDQPPNQRMLEMLSRNIDLLDRMVIELLDVSEMSSGKFDVHRELLQLEKVIWDTVENLSEDIRKAGLDVTVMLRDLETLSIEGDYKRLVWALTNLIRNSINYTLPGGRIIISVKPDSYSDSPVLVLQVADTGVGIAEKDLPHIFELFYRGEARTADGKRLDPRGLGQGLFVTRMIVRAHGGDIEVKSNIGSGSSFIIYLPTNPASTNLLHDG